MELLNKNLLEWFDLTVSNFALQLNKKAEFRKVFGKLNIKLARSTKFTSEYNEPLNKEILFLIYWSCLNEFTSVCVTRWNPNIKFLNNFEIKEVNCKNNRKNKYFPYIRKRYKLFPSNLSCYIFFKEDKLSCFEKPIDSKKLSFYLQAFLNDKNVSEETLLLFNYLCQKRNKLSIIHGNEKTELISKENEISTDTVTISDCKLMLMFICFIFLEKKEIELEFLKLFKKYPLMENNKFEVKGKLIDKFEQENPKDINKKYYKFVFEYKKNIKPEVILINVTQKDFLLYNIDDFLIIEYKIVSKKTDKDVYFTHVFSENVIKVTDDPV